MQDTAAEEADKNFELLRKAVEQGLKPEEIEMTEAALNEATDKADKEVAVVEAEEDAAEH